MITKEDVKKLDLKLVEQSGLGSTIEITYDGETIKTVII